jgi:4-hydroxy-tetrahydrodipicolinate reductase
MADMKIGIVGVAGRMGRMLLYEVCETDGLALGGGVETPGNAAIGEDLGTLAGLGAMGMALGDDARALFAAADAVIEFTSPEATVAHAAMAADAGAIHVIGTTGLSAEQAAALAASAEKTPIVWAPNMSLGVNLLMRLTERVAAALDADYDIEIVEMHHRHKVDAPSGTALGLGRAAAAGRGVDLDAVAERGRDGMTGARGRGAIGFAALRGGDVVGDHTVVFAAEGERVELTHRASSRRIYARGAVRAALWARDRPPGLYSMADVLGL